MAPTTTSNADAYTRTIPSAWSSLDTGGVLPEAQEALDTYKQKDLVKVVVRFKAVGNAPIMKQNFYKITSSNKFQAVIQFLRNQLAWKAGDPLVSIAFGMSGGRPRLIQIQFTYINLAFSPAPDDIVSNLYKVRVHMHRGVDDADAEIFSTTAAWG
ncbi:Ubiquitin-like protein ATG12 [Grifola frondosa]|uniref:Ubiquitin-like protein ATG12 n=1 Tax=Grifola frondosa TaxID=5627 RepID=A0A1C7M9F2_GRIFR|nr:Ubiquitin-like protein ATG12 [Grifola frondosa]